MQECRSVGLQEYTKVGMQQCRNVGKQGGSNVKMQECRFFLVFLVFLCSSWFFLVFPDWSWFFLGFLDFVLIFLVVVGFSRFFFVFLVCLGFYCFSWFLLVFPVFLVFVSCSRFSKIFRDSVYPCFAFFSSIILFQYYNEVGIFWVSVATILLIPS